MKRNVLAVAAVLFSAMMVFPAYAAGWQKDPSGWRWQREDETFVTNGWEWLDGNQDQIAECYYFDKYGYILRNTETPDGCQVNPDGSWVVDGVVQSRKVGEETEAQVGAIVKGGPVTGGYANASLGYRLELAAPAYFVYGDAQTQEQADVTVQLLGKEVQSPSVSVCFWKNTGNLSLEESVNQLVEPQRALGFEAKIETGVVLGDGNTYTKAALTKEDMHIDYWVRLADDTIVCDMAVYSESDKGLVDTAMAAVKPY